MIIGNSPKSSLILKSTAATLAALSAGTYDQWLDVKKHKNNDDMMLRCFYNSRNTLAALSAGMINVKIHRTYEYEFLLTHPLLSTPASGIKHIIPVGLMINGKSPKSSLTICTSIITISFLNGGDVEANICLKPQVCCSTCVFSTCTSTCTDLRRTSMLGPR